MASCNCSTRRATASADDADFLRQLRLLGRIVRHKFVQRRIDQADGDRQAVHGLEDSDEVAPLERQKLVESLAARLRRVRQDHFLNGLLALGALLRLLEILEEHVLGAAKADAFGAHFASSARILRRIGVGAHAELADLIGPFHQCFVGFGRLRPHQINLAGVDGAVAAVERDPVAFAHDVAVDAEFLSLRHRCRSSRRRRCSTCPIRARRRPRGWSCRPWR